MNGLLTPADVSFPGFPNTGDYNDPHLFLAYDGLNKVKSTDSETYFQADAEYAVESGVLDAFKFGVRATTHQRSVLDYYNDGCFAQAPDETFTQCNGIAQWSGQLENRYGQGLRGGPGFLHNDLAAEPGRDHELRQRAGQPARVVAAVLVAQQLRRQREDAGDVRHGQAGGRPLEGQRGPARRAHAAAGQLQRGRGRGGAGRHGLPGSAQRRLHPRADHEDLHRPAAQRELQRTTSRAA